MEFVPASADPAARYSAPASAPPPYRPADPFAPPPHQPYHYYPAPNPNPYPSSYAGAAYETSAPPGSAASASYSQYQSSYGADSQYQSSYGADAYAPHGGYAYQPPAVAASATATSGYTVVAGNGAAATSYHNAAEALRTVNYRPTAPRVGKKRSFEDTMEAKKQKLIMGGASADSVRICVPCNVVCNSETVYAIHLAGEKHSLKVFGHSSKGANAVRAAIPSQAIAVLNKASQKKAKVVKPVSCNICKLECDTEEVLAVHMAGKKHMKNMRRLESSTAKPADKVLPVGDKDLDAKKQAMLDNGTPADAIKVCTVCNIPCNGQAAFDSHLSGQKHINLLKILQQQVAPVS